MDLSESTWRKASRSHDDGDACIEVAPVRELIAVRDSKHPDGPKLVVSRSDFRRLAETIKNL
ncbi:DUF397 domain-containing protein [Actinomadura sp. WMMB 499]|uniref:DUF397 domain-containing protein n=1 Tax=Actinomadura sp. WMMB 499 TaxID=1219491 RepID=UPI0012470AE0|nr:DUF397 domain-containing protein [Actinomadura sp. WMMB 499]QFG23648.1 DUF397 domain-containing protein [Actinomadura sp. WMMB 499]